MVQLVSYVSWVRSHVGLDAQTEPGPFGALVAPDGPESARAFICKPNVPGDANSSCMVVAVGLFDLFARAHGDAGLPGPLGLDRWDHMRAYAKARGALIDHPREYTPEVGDIVHVARADAGGHVAQHWFTMTAADASVDGGRKNEHGFQAIGEARRSFVVSNGYTLEATAWKPVVAVVRVCKLLEALS